MSTTYTIVSDSPTKHALGALGYIALPTASMFATPGLKVVGVDVHKAVASSLNQGRIHIEEWRLGAFVSPAIRSDNVGARGFGNRDNIKALICFFRGDRDRDSGAESPP